MSLETEHDVYNFIQSNFNLELIWALSPKFKNKKFIVAELQNG